MEERFRGGLARLQGESGSRRDLTEEDFVLEEVVFNAIGLL